MTKCRYCGVECEREEKLTDHLTETHDKDELSRVDQRRIERAENNGRSVSKIRQKVASAADETLPTEESLPDATVSRRSLLGAAGAGTLGIAGMATAIATESGPTLADLNGDGTSESPYEITTFEELLLVDDALEAFWVLEDDIDASREDPITPLGTDSAFSGLLDGQGHRISGLKIDGVTSYESSGLFGELVGEIKNLELTNIESRGGSYVGGLAARNDGMIQNCIVHGTVSGIRNTGGLVGDNTGTVERCGSTATVESDSADWNLGGLIGSNGYGSTLRRSYAGGEVLAGGGDTVGGLTGGNFGLIEDVYAAGTVRGDTDVGGAIGFHNADAGTVTKAYWDTEATGQGSGVGGTSGTPDVIGLTTAEMQGSAAETSMSAFDFESVWTSVSDDDTYSNANGYPILQSLGRPVQLEGQGIRTDTGTSAIEINADNVTVTNSTVRKDDAE